MDERQFSEITASFVARAPRDAAAAILQYLAKKHSAPQAALYTVSGSDIELLLGMELGQKHIEWVNSCWQSAQFVLTRPPHQPIQAAGNVLVPLLRHDQVVGLLYLHSHNMQMGPILDVMCHLTEALLRAGAVTGLDLTAVDAYLDIADEDEIQRRKLQLTLDRFEGNRSMAARYLGLSRSAFYRRLEKYGLEKYRLDKDES